MNPYDRFILPRLTNCVCGGSRVTRLRQLVVPRARGRVLEIGFGSGLNLAHYDRSCVDRIWALEPSAQMRALAMPRVARSGLDVRIIDAPAERLPLEAGSVDTVVATFVLCTIPDPSAALACALRALRPGGQLLFCEHGAAPDADVRRWQDRLNRPWRRLAGGCHLNRDIAGLIESAGFRIGELDSAYLPSAPRFVGYVSRGVAFPSRALTGG
ncbi:MAG: methyltransferase domain-containing protein [Burkholderiaceae bacterium]